MKWRRFVGILPLVWLLMMPEVIFYEMLTRTEYWPENLSSQATISEATRQNYSRVYENITSQVDYENGITFADILGHSRKKNTYYLRLAACLLTPTENWPNGQYSTGANKLSTFTEIFWAKKRRKQLSIGRKSCTCQCPCYRNSW